MQTDSDNNDIFENLKDIIPDFLSKEYMDNLQNQMEKIKSSRDMFLKAKNSIDISMFTEENDNHSEDEPVQ